MNNCFPYNTAIGDYILSTSVDAAVTFRAQTTSTKIIIIIIIVIIIIVINELVTYLSPKISVSDSRH